MRFTWPRVWDKTCLSKFLVIFNVVTVLVSKATSVAVPLILKLCVDAIICKEVDDMDDCPQGSECIVDGECPTEQETYILIIIYAASKFVYDCLNNLREIPYAYMAVKAEVSIAHDVYDHVQR